jgi:hypothetical protein
MCGMNATEVIDDNLNKKILFGAISMIDMLFAITAERAKLILFCFVQVASKMIVP